MLLAEQFRPTSYADLIGQESVVAKIDALRPRGLGGRAYWLAGPSGTGKTSIARLLAAEIASQWAIDEIDAQDVTLDYLREFDRSLGQRAMADDAGKTGRALIVNEAHGLRGACVSRLLTILERLPAHVVVIFTTTNEGQQSLFDDVADSGPLLSRCVRLPMAQRGLTEAFAARLVAGARSLGMLNGKGDEFYIKRASRLLKEHRNNLRAAWQAVDSGYLTSADDE